jgi:hypothetical protein
MVAVSVDLCGRHGGLFTGVRRRMILGNSEGLKDIKGGQG